MNARRFVDRRRPDLQAAWGTSNVAIYALPSATGGGPALWLAGALPDRHCFRGSCGGYAFPLWDRRRGEAAHNLSPALLAGLARAYGRAVGPQEVFDAIAALLSATSYTRRHAPDLEASFARIPFPGRARSLRRGRPDRRRDPRRRNLRPRPGTRLPLGPAAGPGHRRGPRRAGAGAGLHRRSRRPGVRATVRRSIAAPRRRAGAGVALRRQRLSRPASACSPPAAAKRSMPPCKEPSST